MKKDDDESPATPPLRTLDMRVTEDEYARILERAASEDLSVEAWAQRTLKAQLAALAAIRGRG